MRSPSLEFRKEMMTNSTLLVKGSLHLSDGKVVELDGDDFVSASFEQATSSDSAFDVGAAVIGKADISLNNYDDRFSEYDFTGSSIVVYVGKQLSAGVEWLKVGTYEVDQPDSYSGVIDLSTLDYMSRFEVEYSEVKTSYPATVGTIVADICSHCGVELSGDGFDNSEYVVSMRPDDDNETCLSVIGYAAQVTGNFARVDADGALHLAWYATSVFESGDDWLDGQHFDDDSPYSSGDTADGGTFDDYSTGAVVDGGTFDSQHGYVHLWAHSSLTVSTDDVVITGVGVTASNEIKSDGYNGEDGEYYLYGDEGYVLSISDNPLIVYGHAAEVAKKVGERVIGMRFRPFSSTCATDISLEPGDPVVVTDRKSNSYRSYANNVSFSVNGSMSASCNAASARRNSAASSSAVTRAAVEARNDLKREQAAREAAIAEIASGAVSTGFFSTPSTTTEGGQSYCMHDQPSIDDSTTIWVFDSSSASVSLDGGGSYETVAEFSSGPGGDIVGMTDDEVDAMFF